MGADPNSEVKYEYRSAYSSTRQEKGVGMRAAKQSASEPLPPPIQHTLGPEWLEACEKLGFDPNAWQNMTLAPSPEQVQAEQARRAEIDASLAERRQQLALARNWLLTIIESDPASLRRALGCCSNCEVLD
jgi:hypothetical protein